MRETEEKSGSSSDHGGGLNGISAQLSLIQRLQEEALRQKDVELDLLRNRIEVQQQELSSKENEIRRLERDRYRQQEERALELGNLVRRGGDGAGHHLINPYQGGQADDSIFQSAARLLCYHQDPPTSFRTHRPPSRLLDWIYGVLLFLLLLHFYNISQMQQHILQPSSSSSTNTYDAYNAQPIVTEPVPLKPWESSPPKPIALMDTRDPFIKQRHTCIQAVRERQNIIFEKVLGTEENLQVLLVDPAYHSNVGDHMLTVAELELIQGTLKRPAPQQCHYVQANFFYPVCTDVVRGSDREAAKVALWHAGGNWGDLWRDAQDVRIPSFKTILENGYKVVGLPQSLFYLDESLRSKDATAIKEKVALGLGLAKEEEGEAVAYRRRRRSEAVWFEKAAEGEDFDWGDNMGGGWDGMYATTNKPVNTSALDTPEGIALARSKTTLMWREQQSFEEASQLYPFVTNMVVPDMAFQLGPYAPIRKHPDQLVDFILFLREDKESKVSSERSEDSIRGILPKPDMTFKIVDWSDRLATFGTTDNFFTDTSIELLSLGKVVVCDRLHAAILAYLTGLPFVYIDQVSGKISKTLSAALNGTAGCLGGEQAHWARAFSLQEALTKAAEMIEAHGLNHGGRVGFLRGLVPF